MKIKILIPLDYNPIPHQQGIKSRAIFDRAKNFKFISHYKTAKLREYQDYLRLCAISQKNELHWTAPEKFFKYDLLLVFKSRNHGDPDNCKKAILDAVEGVLFSNDKWGCDSRTRYAYGSQARIELTVESMEAP